MVDPPAPPKDRDALIRYLRAAIGPLREVDLTVEFFIQLAIKQLADNAPPRQSIGDGKGQSKDDS
jgi:hypothetical protein